MSGFRAAVSFLTIIPEGGGAADLAAGAVVGRAAGGGWRCVGLTGPAGLALMAASGFVAWGLGAWASKLLGGVTGDVYGAINETAEVAMLVLAAVWPMPFPIRCWRRCTGWRHKA